jgi:DNA-directed RNA polymerase specialized sigma24 family protein
MTSRFAAWAGPEHHVTDDLRQRFDALVPELTQRAAELAATVPEPRPTAADLVEATWKIVAGKRKRDAALRVMCLRELEACAHNVAIRQLLDKGNVDGAIVRMLPQLTAWATNLSRGVPGNLEPQELAAQAYEKLKGAAMFAAAENPLGYAFRAVKNLVIDHTRRHRHRTVAVGEHHLPVAELEMSDERLTEILRRAGLSEQEQCMLVQVVFEKLAVSSAQKHCGGPGGAPYYVLEKILGKVATALGITRSKR